MHLTSAFQDKTLCAGLLARLTRALDSLHAAGGKQLRFMEVCGTHTMAIFQSGLRSLLPKGIAHLSGPGCPVCVTHDADIAAILHLAEKDSLIVATFGDMLRVPGPNGNNLKHAQAAGARVEIVYSPLDALTLAAKNPGDTVVFLGIGFEATAPAVAATLLCACQQQRKNFRVFSLHKRVPPVLRSLLNDADTDIDAFLLPGHVSTVLGLAPYAFLAEARVPGVVGGFEPADILLALCLITEQIRDGQPAVVNAYPRAVNDAGNPKARALLDQVFVPSDALWRGMGRIAQSGFAVRPDFAAWDAAATFDLRVAETPPPRGCRCGDVLKGRIAPPACPLFGKVCTPATPTGPCMVSTEGSCAACYNYSER
ncbi:MAG: [NiFe] hydrogenase maturation protein HypD [Candidatus Desulfovibrio kirbyi]|jgi:hydrogenase expression/formation protein HypD|uniref:[NiFe] hydrogenase maturation protein HypD n=1 Tax=Candidatus Desulfovibrio kirbyi TaxID=2696086 RepID=A0A6L2R5T9_9BACT|nr:hydrogenase formation protein HypD [Desulfovibrio sp.]GFH62907.1 MAG: [NiFe] hydrogenase maturation protein HypD [Candidatus Desulfovibrio kirbyi]